MVENKITGLNGNIELNKTTEFSKPIIINGVITNYNKVYVTFSDEKFKLSIYSDTNSAHNVTTIDYDSKIYAMNIVEKETHILIIEFLYSIINIFLIYNMRELNLYYKFRRF